VIEPGYLRDAIAALYTSDPDQFTERRGVLAAHAKEAGDAAVARAVAALRKPTRSAWVVNQLVRSDPGAIPRLSALGDELRAAERFMNGTKLRELSVQRRQLVETLLRQAFAVSGQQSPPAAMRDEVAATLTAAMSDPQVAAQLRAGTLLRAVSRAGFGSLAPADLTFAPDLAGLTPTKTATARPAKPAKTGTGPARPATARRPPAGPPTVQERAGRARAAREQAAQERAEIARVKREQAARERAERDRRRAAIATAEKAATSADRTARTAAKTLAELDETVERLAGQLGDARQRQAEARVASRQALNAQRKAHRDLDRLTGPS
jgi:hypothetical protein